MKFEFKKYTPILAGLIAGCMLGYFSRKPTNNAVEKKLDKCVEEVVGGRWHHSIIIIKALTQIRADNLEDALTTLETTLDLNVALVWEMAPDSIISSNTVHFVGEYRSQFGDYKKRLVADEDSVLMKRNSRAEAIIKEVKQR